MSGEKDNKNFKTVSNELDTLAIAILETLQSIISEKQYLDNTLKEGYINMAKSRYLMRGQKISTLQINTTKLIPSFKVISNSDTVEGVEYLSYHSLESSDLKVSEHESECNMKRRSVKVKDLSKKLENTSIDSEDKESSSESVSRTDPLRWFGVLVPESLRTCQSRFKQATDTALKIASLQNQLKAFGKKYKELKFQKDSLMNNN